MSIFDTLAESGVTQEDLEKAASARLFAEAAATEGIDLSQLSEDQAEELYALWADDSEKNASADEFINAAAAEGIDLNELTEDQVGELYNYWATGGEEKVASAEELLKEAAVNEATAKLAEAEYIGRYMARVYSDEMNKIAAEGDPSMWERTKGLPGKLHGHVGGLGERLGAEAGKGHLRGYGALGAGTLAAGGLAYGAKRLLSKKPEAEKQSSIDDLIEERALEMLIEVEAEKVAGDYIGGMAEGMRANQKRKAAKKSLMMTHDEREELLREGHEGGASASRKTRLGNMIGGGTAGALGGAGLGVLGGGRRGALAGALVGGALGAGASGALSRMSEKLHTEKANDRSALRAELARGVNTPGRLKQEHKAIADLVAAREGRGSGGGLLNVSLNRGGQSDGIKREAGTGEKRSSAFDAIVEQRALELLKEAEGEGQGMYDKLKGLPGKAHGHVGSLGERLGAEAGKGHLRGYGAIGAGTLAAGGLAYGGKKLLDRRKAGAEKQSSIDDVIEARALEMIEEAQFADDLDEAALELLAANGY